MIALLGPLLASAFAPAVKGALAPDAKHAAAITPVPAPASVVQGALTVDAKGTHARLGTHLPQHVHALAAATSGYGAGVVASQRAPDEQNTWGPWAKRDGNQILSLAADRVAGTKPKSTMGWVIASLVFTVIGIILLIWEVFTLDWKGMGAAYKKSFGKNTGTEEPLASEKTEATDDDGIEPALREKRYIVLALMILCLFGVDIYSSMPFPFMYGIGTVRGVSAGFTGFYLSGMGLFAAITIPFVKELVSFLSATKIQHVAILLVAAVSIPQGLAEQLDNGGYYGLLTILRVLEGAGVGLAEMTINTVIFFVFPKKEIASAMTIITSVRGLITVLSPPLGAVTYTAGGMAFPFLLAGIVNVVSVVLVKIFSPGIVGLQARTGLKMLSFLKYPAMVAALLNYLAIFLATLTLGSAAQPWLGVAPYNMTPNEICVLNVIFSLSLMFSAGMLGAPLKTAFGPVVSCWIGILITIVGYIFIGGPPLIIPVLPKLRSIGYMTFTVMGIGSGIAIPASVDTFVVVLESHGIDATKVSSIMGAWSALTPMLGVGVAPLIFDAVMGASSVSVAVLVMWGLTIVIFLSSLFLQWHLIGVQVTEQNAPDAADGLEKQVEDVDAKQP